jgi:predicted RNase H-like HicB family nuclease
MAEIEGETTSGVGTPSSAVVLNEIREIKAELRRRVETILIPIATLAPEPYELVREIPAVVQPAGDEFIATFFDANISTAGDTQEEAVANLRSLLLDMFEYLESEPPEALGPEPARQLGVLRAFLKRIQNAHDGPR